MTISTRICVRRDTTANWNTQTGFIPLLGEVIVYMDHRTDGNGGKIPGIKIGDGKTVLASLPFIDEGMDASGALEQLQAHLNNTDVHITAEDRANWNSKVGCDVVDDVLKFFN